MHEPLTSEEHLAVLQEALVSLEKERESAVAMAAHLSHELRTPLNGVIGMAQLLIGTPLNREQEEMVNLLLEAGENLLELVNNVLDLSKIESKALALDAVAFELHHVIESALDMVSRTATEHHVYLTYEIDPAIPETLIGDTLRIRQILVNLLGNAVRFTENGDIHIKAVLQGMQGDQCMLVLHVSDTGTGIPHHKLETLFLPYISSDRQSRGGTGLGLVISRRLARIMGGDISVESREGQGSTFSVALTLKNGHPDVRHGTVLLAGRVALILETHQPTAQQLSSLLDRAGMEVHKATSLEEAVDCLQRTPIDVLLVSMGFTDKEFSRSSHWLSSLVALISPGRIIELNSLGQFKSAVSTNTLSRPVRREALYSAFVEALRHAQVPPSEDMSTSSSSTTPGSTLKVLLAEDNLINQKVAIRILSTLGYNADVVENGSEAVHSVEKNPYDLILMDIMMPVMDGLEATRRIRGLPLKRQPRIVAVTANALVGDKERCLAAGMDDYLPKPLRVDDLARMIRQMAPSDATASKQDSRAPSVIELDALRDLRNSIGEEDFDFFDSLVSDFLVDAGQIVAEMRSSLREGRTLDLKRAAHTLKSSSAMFGALDLSKACFQLEQATSSEDMEVCIELTSKIPEMLALVHRDLSALRAKRYEGL